jgi:phage head maturation protease
MSDAERRFTSVPVEIRAGAEDKLTIGGYAAKFDRMSQNLGGFVEQIARVLQQVPRRRLARCAGPLQPRRQHAARHHGRRHAAAGGRRDRPGLRRRPARDPADVYELVQRGDVRQSSFAFIAFEDDWSTTTRASRCGRCIRPPRSTWRR